MNFRTGLFLIFTLLISCGERAQPVAKPASINDFKSEQQNQFLSKYNAYDNLFKNSSTEQERRDIEQRYNEWFNAYIKDTLQNFNNWAGRLTEMDGNANVTYFKIAALDADVSFTGLVTVTTPAFDSLSKVKKGDYVIFTARPDAVQPPWPKEDKSLNTLSVYIFLDSVTICSTQQE